MWPFNAPFEVLGVHRDSLSQNGNCLGSVSAHSLTLPRTSLDSREYVMTPGFPLGSHPSNAFAFAPGFPLGPHPSNAFAFAPELPSFWLPGFFPLDSRNIATPCLGREPKARVATKLMQQHTNNWDASKLLSPSIGLPLVNVHPIGYGWIYSIFCGHKRFDVTIGNHPCCFYIYFIVMLATSLGKNGTWVQCKHMYPLQQKVSLYAKWFH